MYLYVYVNPAIYQRNNKFKHSQLYDYKLQYCQGDSAAFLV